MSAVVAAVLEPVGQARVALQGVDVAARLDGLLSEVAVTQTYRNLETVAIEATYTFPLPLDAVLLELTLDLNGRRLTGVVQPKAQAEAAYEGAIDEGDTAVLLQQIEPGTYSMNLGNLLPQETAVIRFRYAQLHRWQGDRLRFHLPTTIAPRYGDPQDAGFAPHQVPEHALTADHGFTLRLEIAGALAAADFECPSHPLGVGQAGDVRVVTLSGGSRLMDRDFVLVLRAPATPAGQGLWARDGERTVALASFHLPEPDGVPTPPRCVTLVVDCSGSMGGDSIAQARSALQAILGSLRPADHFNLVAFGSHHRLVFPAAVPATEANLLWAGAFVSQLDATMGGTEIGAALEAAYRSGAPEGLQADVLLITDGEVTDHRRVVERARQSGQRVFTVGVGSAVAEAFVRQLAEHTGGACELVSPRERMAERIVRHFARIDQPRVAQVDLDWPRPPVRQVPARFDTLFAGDTLHAFGWFEGAVDGTVQVRVEFADGRVVAQQATLLPCGDASDRDALARVGAHAGLAELDTEAARTVAVQYQLVTEQTSCVLVHARAAGEKAEGVPVLRKVPQVLAAGWGGTGAVAASVRAFRTVCHFSPAPARVRDGGFDLCIPDEFFEPPTTLPRDWSALVSALDARYADTSTGALDLRSLADLQALGVAADTVDALRAIVDDGTAERDVVIGFLVALLDTPAAAGLSRHARRLIRRAARHVTVDPLAQRRLRALTAGRAP